MMADARDKPNEAAKEHVFEQDESGSGRSTSTQSTSSPVLKRSSTTPVFSTGTSATTSPKPSREGSPTRHHAKPRANLGAHSPGRSRKNSTDKSPVRGIPTVPSAAAIQRALSAAGAINPSPNPHTLQHDERSEMQRSQRTNRPPSQLPKSTPRTPRLSSPPPSSSATSNKPLANTSRKADQSQSTPTTPSIVIDRPILEAAVTNSDAKDEPPASRSGMRTPNRTASGTGAALETVQESSLPASPAGKAKGNERPQRIEEDPLEESLVAESKSRPESGNESTGNKNAGRKSGDEGKEGWRPASTASASAKPAGIQSKKSYTNLPSKLKTASEGSVKNMTVETETVNSNPQVAGLGGPNDRTAAGRTDTSSLRMKASTETIRPKKDKKKQVRKTASLNAGGASSKADIFEAKVASAVGEADSSDSEEAFVYESNPPEPPSARAHKFHSRTPSTASTLSQIDHYGNKGRPDSHQNVVKKKSMKFARNYDSINHPIDQDGSVRGPSQAIRGGTPHHHHIGRFGRSGHTSILDRDSPFSNGSKTPRTAAAQLQAFSAQHNGQRSPRSLRLNNSSRKAEEGLSYDLEGEGADDERAPLMGTTRNGRNRRRPLPGSVRQAYANEDRSRRFCGRMTAFVALGTLLGLLIAAITVMLVLCTKPLYEVMIQDIRNVLASESEIMMDLQVRAINPNIIAITVSDVDLNVFAKSKHVRSPSTSSAPSTTQPSAAYPPEPTAPGEKVPGDWVDPPQPTHDAVKALDGVDKGTDPMPFPDDPTSDSQTMLLGQIVNFDSPLIFEPSPIHHRSLLSTGEVRLSRPGNKTEEGGSARWERVLLHDFELIVRGVVKYSLPISSKIHSSSVGGKIVVHPTEEDSESDKGGMRLTHPRPQTGSDGGSNVIIEPPPIQKLTSVTKRRPG